MYKLDILGATTPYNMILVKYDKAKLICYNIWHKPMQIHTFEDIFHDTIYKCLDTLGRNKFSQDYMKGYFFKAFRINMIRHFGYSYNKYNSGLEIEKALIPYEIEYDNHIDGFGMLDMVGTKFGEEYKQMLWDNLNGMTYNELDRKYGTNSFYELGKVKIWLKHYYHSAIPTKMAIDSHISF